MMKGGFIVRSGNSNIKDPPKNRHRPLGTVRKSVSSSIESLPKLPPLRPASEHDVAEMAAKGNAMQVPTQQENTESQSRTVTSISQRSPAGNNRRQVHTSKSVDTTVSTAKPEDRSQELKEALIREKLLKQQVLQLEKVIEDLQIKVKDKDEHISDLEKKFAEHISSEEKYRRLYESEMADHKQTTTRLDMTQTELDAAHMEITVVKETHQSEIDKLNSLMEIQLKKLQDEKEREITIRDEKLNKLKKQMADALKGNSWERQQQLDELTKELSRIQEESDNLRFKIKALQKSKASGSCSNCETSQTRLVSSQKALTEKDSIIKELKQVCAKYEKQLEQQSLMLKKIAMQNGHST